MPDLERVAGRYSRYSSGPTLSALRFRLRSASPECPQRAVTRQRLSPRRPAFARRRFALVGPGESLEHSVGTEAGTAAKRIVNRKVGPCANANHALPAPQGLNLQVLTTPQSEGVGTPCMGPWMSRVKTWREPLFFFLSARTEVGRASHRSGRRRSTSRVRRRRPDRWLASGTYTTRGGARFDWR